MNQLSRDAVALVFVIGTAACSRGLDLDKVPVGQAVAVTKGDGEVVEGTVTSRDDRSLMVKTGTATKAIPRNEIVDVTVVDKTKPIVLPPAARFREYTLPEGTALSLRLATSIDSRTNGIGDPVEATLAEAVSIGGAEVLPAGSTVKGTVSAVEASAKVKGLAHISLHFVTVAPRGRDDRYEVDATWSETAATTKKQDATKIGIGAGAGAAIGALLGGKGGAAKGVAIGGGAGTAAVLSTSGKEVEHSAGAMLTARLKRNVEVRVPTVPTT